MKAKKLPSGRWRVRLSVGKGADGRYHYKSFTADTKKEVEYLASCYSASPKRKIDITVGEAVDAYIKSQTNVLSPATIRGYRSIERNHIKDKPIADLMISDVDYNTIQKYINIKAANLSAKTTRNIFALIRPAVRAIDPNAQINVNLPKLEPLNYDVPVDDEVKLLMNNAERDLRIAIIFAAIGTMRRSEACAVEYSDIKDNFIHVQRVIIPGENNEQIVRTLTKTDKSNRWIEFPPEAIKEIGEGEGRIIRVSPQQITDKFGRLRKRFGITCRYHDLRHYAASVMHAIRVPDQYIMARGGWASDNTLKKVYRNVLRDKQNEFTDQTNAYLSDRLF